MVCGCLRKEITCKILGICTLVHFNKNFSDDHSICADRDRYVASNVEKYLDTDTIKASTKFYKTTFPPDMILTKADASTSYDQGKNLTREFNIYYRDCIESLIRLLSTRVDLIFSVHKLANLSSNPGKVNFECLVHILRYIWDNKTLGLN